MYANTKEYEGMSVLLYARVSTDDKGQTTDQQIIKMKEWSVSKGCRIVGIYADEESGGTLERDQFTSVLGRIALGGINILLAWSETRLSRNVEDMRRITKICESNGTVIRYVSSSVRPEDTDGQMINTIMTAFGEQERANIRKNTKVKMDLLKNNGKYLGRPLSMIFAHHIDDMNTSLTPPIPYRDMIATEGEHRTKVVSLSMIYDLSYTTSIPKMAKMIGVSDTTLRNALREEGVLDKVLQNRSKKGLNETRVQNTEQNHETRDTKPKTKQVTALLGNDDPLLEKAVQ